jgi:two-component system LytT family response regulator
MKFTVMIIDDELDAIDNLRYIISQNNEEYEIIAHTQNPIEGFKFMQKTLPDILFLDIKMPEMSGFDLITSLSNPEIEIIITSGFDKYGIEAIKYNVCDYILKPVSFSEVNQALDKAKKRISEKRLFLKSTIDDESQTNIEIPTENGFKYLKTDKIIRVEADGAYTNIHLSDKKIVVSKSISIIENILPKNQFFRSHRSHLINLFYVDEFNRGNGTILMNDGVKVQLSKQKVNEFKSRVMNI